jgi:hypothetical protein
VVIPVTNVRTHVNSSGHAGVEGCAASLRE